MSSLSSENGASNSEVSFVGDERCSSQVGADTNTFKHLGKTKETSDTAVGHRVIACRDGSGASSSQSTREERDVLCFIGRNLLNVGTDIGIVACAGKGSRVESGESLGVKGGFKMLQDEGKVENIGIGECRCLTFNNSSSRDGRDSTKDGSNEDITTHD